MPLPTSFVVKNGSKIFALHVFRHARPIVVDLEHDQLAVGVVPRADDQRASAVRGQHRLLGVDDQIQQHLLNLMRVGENRRQARRRAPRSRVMFVTRCSYDAQRQRFADDLVQIDHRARGLPFPREGQQVADDARGALGFAEDDVESAPRRFVERCFCDRRSAQREDRRQWIVQLVRDAGDRLSERRQSSPPAASC